MKVIDPGHHYELTVLDGEANSSETLLFVKRQGEKYPGNTFHHHGTTLQEVLRACCERLRYVNGQIRSHYNDDALEHVRKAIQLLEQRAAERHERSTAITLDEAEFGKCCPKCLHVQCTGNCHPEAH